MHAPLCQAAAAEGCRGEALTKAEVATARRHARLRSPAGVLELLSAADLARADVFGGSADPYATVFVNGVEVAQSVATRRPHSNTREPQFDAAMDLHGLVVGQNTVRLELWGWSERKCASQVTRPGRPCAPSQRCRERCGGIWVLC